MRTICRAVLFTAASIGAVAPLQAGQWSDYFWGVTRTVNEWPAQYVPADRADTQAPFFTMVGKGWARQNTVDQFHFEDNESQLTSAGKIKIREIMTTAPHKFRTIHYVTTYDPQLDANRIAAIQQEVAKYVGPEGAADVVTTNLPTMRYPAEYVDMVDRKFRESTPEPRLPAAQAGGAGGL